MFLELIILLMLLLYITVKFIQLFHTEPAVVAVMLSMFQTAGSGTILPGSY